MARLSDICGELKSELTALAVECQSIWERVWTFDDFVCTNMCNRLKRKLKIVADFITAQAEALYKYREWFYKQWSTQLDIFVVLAPGAGFAVQRALSSEMATRKKNYEASGYSISSVDEIIATIDRLVAELASGVWVNAAEWLRDYGRADGLDFGNYP